MMTKGVNPPSEMAHARLSEGISVIFDQDTLPGSASPRSRSRSRSSHSSVSSRRPRDAYRGRRRSSSSCSSVSSSSPGRSSPSRPRSRSHPRCHRPASRCRCVNHRRYGHRHGHRRRHHRGHPSRSHRRSPSPHRSSRRRSYRSRSRSHSRSASQRRTYRRFVGRDRCRFSQSPSRNSGTHRSRSRSSGRSAVSLSLDDKRELIMTAKANATKILGIEQLEIPESVKPILEESMSATEEPEARVRPEPEARVRPDPVHDETSSQSSETETDEDVPSPKMSPKRKIISFSIHNSVARPTTASLSGAKVTPRVDSYESRKPYGHWVPVRRPGGRTSQPRKRTTLATASR